ncbi:MAG: UvrD-helicase domain-containing protein, partial [bacterium]|nr:UvrD-helicase domain-containing protein [bacterium]
MDRLLKDLNQAQKQAVMAGRGPILMLAGAGSGKTKTLTHRIAYLIVSKKVSPSNILAVTFTNKAAGEMRTRLSHLLGKSYVLPYLGTFHSIAVKILRREASYIGYAKDFIIYDQSDQLSLVKAVMRSLNIDEKSYQPQTFLSMISSAKSELITADRYAHLTSGTTQELAARVYENYQKELKKTNAFDFDDLIMQTVRLFSENPEILAKYRSQFTDILIDEYQDTNHAQYKLVNMLASEHKNICVVGDDWQSIYSWRGANYQNILNFEKDYPNAKVIKLEQNYRSTQNILDGAHSVITKNQNRSEKKLWTNIKPGKKIMLTEARSEVFEGQFIVETIEDQISQDPNLTFKDFAVLYRTNAQSRSLEDMFLKYQIPYQIVGGVRFYERREIKDILAFLKFIAQPSDQVSFARIINLPPRGLGKVSLEKFKNFWMGADISILEAAKNASQIGNLTPRAVKSFTEFYEMIEGLSEKSVMMKVSDFVNLVMKKTGYLDYLDDGTIVAEGRVENLKELISVAKTFDNLDLKDFLSGVSLISDIDMHSDETDAVTLMTLHSAKGLEFDTVFIAGVEEGIFPHSRSVTDAAELEEERRLMYVGMTRAKKRLFLINTTTRLIYGTTQYNPPSRFLNDIPPNLIEKKNIYEYKQNFNSDFDDQNFSQLDLNVGDKVAHPQFGEGVVKSLDGANAQI